MNPIEQYWHDLKKAKHESESFRKGGPLNVQWLIVQMLYSVQASLRRIEDKGGGSVLDAVANHDERLRGFINSQDQHNARADLALETIVRRLEQIDPPPPPQKFGTVISAVRTRKT